jgi:hypothetical protein
VSDEKKAGAAVIETAPEDREADILNKAIDWVMGENPRDEECPFCSKGFSLTESAQPNRKMMRLHLREQHSFRCIQAHTEKNIEVDVRNDEPLENFHQLAGIELQDDLDKFNALYVPEQLRREVAKEGGSLRWARPDKVTQYKQQGGQVVEAKDRGDMGPRQGSTEDSSVRANELVLMRFDAEPTLRRRAAKEAKADHVLQSSKENLLKDREGVERAVYDGMIRNNYDRQTAGQVARAIAHGEQQGKWRGGDDRKHHGITIKRGENITQI